MAMLRKPRIPEDQKNIRGGSGANEESTDNQLKEKVIG
jgi:hypothetical protein